MPALFAAAVIAGPASAGISESELRTRIETFVISRTAAAPDAIQVPSLRDFTRASAAVDAVAVRLSARESGRVRGSMPVTVSLESRGREFKRGVVTVALRAERVALVAARPVARGSVIGEADVRKESVSSSRLVRGSVVDADQIVGRRATRSLREGTVYRHDLIEDVPLVLRGGDVRIRLDRGLLRIEAVGLAREDGVLGRPVRVLNLQSRREIVGVVREDGVVHVDF
ncbi:MAG: flagellar basal body P-ring formation chaperone FlgA [Myxococcota bacterium]